MIKTPTVFILGAGASVPYGLPTGRALVDIVIGNLKDRGARFRQLLEIFPGKDVEIAAFVSELERSRKSSVDAFLEHRQEFLDIGKAAIAQALIPFETEFSLFSNSNSGDWCRYLIDLMNTRYTHYIENRVSFITFNYDRSLEHYLHSSICATYGKTTDEVGRLLQEIPIIHVHGHLTRLPFQDPGGRAYTDRVDVATISAAARSIRIISESIDPAAERPIICARKIISEAKRVCFLGFGYNEINLSRLGFPYDREDQEVYGSAFGLKTQEAGRVSAVFNSKIGLAHSSWDALGTLREWIPLD